MNSEMLGLSHLQIALGKTDHLVAHINSNDKEPSWDGDVEVQRKAGHVHAKADLILKVPVQVKGHCKPNLKKKSIKYSIQYADLKNYLAIGGTIFFVIYINDSGDKAAIYYADLLPYDLKKHLKAYDGDPYKYKSIELKTFPKKKNDIVRPLTAPLLLQSRCAHLILHNFPIQNLLWAILLHHEIINFPSTIFSTTKHIFMLSSHTM